MSTNQTTEVKVVPVAGRIGAEIQGVKLSGDLDPTVFNQIKRALDEYRVVFFKGQNHLDDASQEAFAKLLGKPYAHPTAPAKENTNYILELDSKKIGATAGGAVTNPWHTDVTFVPDVPRYSVLRGVTIPSVGGDTVWANTNTAYDDLPQGLKTLADELWSIHSNENDYVQNISDSEAKANGQEFGKKFSSTVFKTKHPVVHLHEATGKKHLLLGGFAKKLEGYSTSESEALLSIFQSYITRLENTVRWRWTEGDVVIWDNLATQHYPIADYKEHRVVRRVTVGKSVPINQKNESSTLLSKKDN
jgi:alpha-ketoglutarate-dependent sulfate ester dioxygenase